MIEVLLITEGLMMAVMRLVTEADAPRILEIYAPIVQETTISFEYEVPGEDEMRQRIRGKLEHGYPWLVMENDDLLLGYAYAGPADQAARQ